MYYSKYVMKKKPLIKDKKLRLLLLKGGRKEAKKRFFRTHQTCSFIGGKEVNYEISDASCF